MPTFKLWITVLAFLPILTVMPAMPLAKKSATAKKPAKTSGTQQAATRLSRLRRPDNIAVEDWQIQLRRQFGRDQSFLLENIGGAPIFSEFAVTNPHTSGRYRVTIRGAALGESACSCPDFATNDLGTCKHIEFTLAKLETKRGAKAALRRGFQPPYSELYLHYAGARGVRFRPGTDCPPALDAAAAALFEQSSGWTLASDRFGEVSGFLAAAQKMGHAIRCDEDALAFVAATRDAHARRRIMDNAYPQGADSAPLTKLLKVNLYRYQLEGALFAARAGRALIGDEMGLGKTIQAIAAAELMTRHFGAERVLIICPTSLKHQWQREIARFAGHEAQVIQGLRPARQLQYRNEASYKITNYDTLARDLDLIDAWSPDVVIVDEAQRIKNWNTIAARALKRIVSPYAIVLTGTPLENRLEELISIVQFVDRHRLGPTWRLLHEHQRRDETGRVVGYQGLDRVGATLAPIMLRRRKAEVLDQLPERIDNTRFVPMTVQQMTHHAENGDTVKRIVLRWRKTGFLSDGDQRRLTCSLQNMRMSCNSTFLLDHETDFGVKADELAGLLDELLIDPDSKVVIFSQWVRTHEILIRRLDARGWGHVLFHGGIASDKRPALVDRFIADPDCRIFLSTDAGSVGLNLQHAASVVINMDLPWNPAVLEQRIGRVHRIGQKRSVQVINLVSQGTIEEGMLSVLAFKKSLFAGVLDGGESEIFMNGTRLSKFMESVEEVTAKMGEAEPMAGAESAESGIATARQGHGDDLEENNVAVMDSALSPAPPKVGTAASSADPWAPLIDAGLRLIESLASAQTTLHENAAPSASQWIETDPVSGKAYLKLPLPDPLTVQRLTDALGGLLAGLRR